MNYNYQLLLKIFLILAIISGCKNKQTEEALPPAFSTKTLDTVSAIVYTEYPAVIQSENVIQIRPHVSGYLANIAVKEGSYVNKGSLLFKIDDADFKQKVNAAKAQLESVNAKKDNAMLEVKKLQPLVEKGIISPYELESAQSNLRALEASYDQAEAEYQNALINLGYTSIKAPVSGVLSRIYVREGSLINTSMQEALTTISSEGDIAAYFSFDEKKLTPIRKFKRFQDEKRSDLIDNVELVLADGSVYEHKGKVESATGIIDRATGSIQLKVNFPNPEMDILSGSSGILRFPMSYNGCYRIPQKATFELQDKILVYILNADGTVNSKAIKVEGISGTDYVVTEGIEPNTTIVTEGTNKLKEGMKITPKK